MRSSTVTAVMSMIAALRDAHLRMITSVTTVRTAVAVAVAVAVVVAAATTKSMMLSMFHLRLSA